MKMGRGGSVVAEIGREHLHDPRVAGHKVLGTPVIVRRRLVLAGDELVADALMLLG